MSIKLDYRNNLRGIRKCPRCGTFNGNRAANCKNRSCQHKLRDDTNTERKPSQSACAVRLLPNYAHLYSVCLRSGVRNFIVASVGADGTISGVSIASGTTSTSVKSNDEALIKRLILNCKSTANALPLHRTTIDSLVISEAEQRSLWEKQSQSNGPLVQRLGNDQLFAVGHLQAAYGLCHVLALRKNQKYSQFQCDCLSTNERKASPVICWHILAVVAGLLSSSEKPDERWKPLLQHFVGRSTTAGHCHEPDEFQLIDASVPSVGQMSSEPLLLAAQSIEMIDCILNPTMMELFCDDADEQPGLVSLDALMDMPTEGPIFELAIGDTRSDAPSVEPCSPDVVTANAESLHLMDCQIELMDEFDLTDRIDFCPSDIECDESMLLPASVIENLSTEVKPREGKKEKLVEVTTKKSALRQCGRVEKEKLTRGSYSVRKLMKVLESNGVIFNRLQRSRNRDAVPNPGKSPVAPGYEAILCGLSFTRWLEAVIEQLNAIIDYNTDGKPTPQTFRIHEDFFRCLRARFSIGHRLRKPEETRTPETAESSGAGVGQRTLLFRFSHHKSLLHVFRTDRIQLSFQKSFVRASDDSFIAIDLPEDSQEGSDAKDLSCPIRAHRYSTYIKMGRYKHEADPNRVYNFSVEWTGGVLPRSGFGDLRISFEYGHRINNQYVPPPGEVVGEEI